MDPRTARMKDLVRLVRRGKEDPAVYGLNTLMRSFALETAPVDLSALCSQLGEALISIGAVMCDRAMSYVVDRIGRRSDLSDAERENYVRESRENWTEFALQLKRNTEAQLPNLEEVIYDKIFSFEPELFLSGFIRLEHQLDLDCTDVEGAHALANDVDRVEQKLSECLKRRATLRAERARLQQQLNDLDRMTSYAEAISEQAQRLDDLSN